MVPPMNNVVLNIERIK